MKRYRAAVLAIPLLGLAAGCTSGPGQKKADPEGGDRPALFKVASRQLSQLRIDRVHRSAWAAEVQTTGTVDWDGDHTTQVITQVGGPITRIVADLGRHVKVGDALLYVSSPDLAAAVSAYRKAANRLDLARRALDRNRDLLDHHVIAQKDLEASQADYHDAFTDVQTSLDALRIFGVSKADLEEARTQDVAIRPELAVRSPLAGVVVQRLVLPGQVVQAGSTACFVISDTATLWVQGHLHENELTSVHAGDRVDVRSAASAETFDGRVAYVGAMLDPATRTTPVRVVTANRGGLLKKDQFVDLVIHASARRDVLVVPTSAVLYTSENFPFVYREVQPGRFARAIVRLGAQRGEEFEVLSGLNDGDAIVAEGAVFLQFAESTER